MGAEISDGTVSGPQGRRKPRAQICSIWIGWVSSIKMAPQVFRRLICAEIASCMKRKSGQYS